MAVFGAASPNLLACELAVQLNAEMILMGSVETIMARRNMEQIKRVWKGRLGLVIAVFGIQIFALGGGYVFAIEPPQCELEIYGAEISDVPRDGELSGVDYNEKLFAIHFPGGEYIVDSSEGEPPGELELASDGAELLTVQEPTEMLHARRLHLYHSDAEIGAGSWQVVGRENSSAIEVLDPPEEALVAEGSPEVDIRESSVIRESYTTRAEQAEQALRIQIPLPEEWMEWESSLENNSLFVVRFEVDEKPESSPLEEDDYVRISSERVINAYDGRMSDCWDQITEDWYGRETLHGLVWPVGMDPSVVSLRFDVALEEYREDVDAYYGPIEENGTSADAGANGDAEAEELDTESGGCYSVPVNGGNSSLIFLFLLVLIGRFSVGYSDADFSSLRRLMNNPG